MVLWPSQEMAAGRKNRCAHWHRCPWALCQPGFPSNPRAGKSSPSWKGQDGSARKGRKPDVVNSWVLSTPQTPAPALCLLCPWLQPGRDGGGGHDGGGECGDVGRLQRGRTGRQVDSFLMLTPAPLPQAAQADLTLPPPQPAAPTCRGHRSWAPSPAARPRPSWGVR